jgi:hypothetical protein
LQKIIQQAYHREFLLFCALTTGLLRLRIYWHVSQNLPQNFTSQSVINAGSSVI